MTRPSVPVDTYVAIFRIAPPFASSHGVHMADITETVGHCVLRSCALPPVIGRAGSPSGLRTTQTPAVSAVRPGPTPEKPHIPALDSIKDLSAEYGGTASTMMWRNGRFPPYNGGAVLF